MQRQNESILEGTRELSAGGNTNIYSSQSVQQWVATSQAQSVHGTGTLGRKKEKKKRPCNSRAVWTRWQCPQCNAPSAPSAEVQDLQSSYGYNHLT